MQRILFLVHREAEDAFGTLLFMYLRMNEISSETLVVKKYVFLFIDVEQKFEHPQKTTVYFLLRVLSCILA